MKKVAILQPYIPHYREDFFKGIQSQFQCDLFCYENQDYLMKNNFNDAKIQIKALKSFQKYGFLFYNPFVFRKYDVLVLMLNFGHLSTWLILLTKFIHRKKVVVWGQGISVKRYMKEEIKPSFLLKKMIYLSDYVWLYTPKELKQWRSIFTDKKMTSLSNTISDVSEILDYKPDVSKEKLKDKYKIKEEVCFIFCARFNNPFRRVDLLVKAIESFDVSKYGFIIIGDGSHKPIFKGYSNVYDFGSVYNKEIKNHLFTIADFYFQPGWVGLSVVEALAYGKPVITFKRSKQTLQCVEYAYLNEKNSIIVNTIKEMCLRIEKLSFTEIETLSRNAKSFTEDRLTMKNMVNNACKSINFLT